MCIGVAAASLMTAACSSSSSGVATGSSGAPTVQSTTTSTTTSTTSSVPTVPDPTLGRLAGPLFGGSGFGQVRPAAFSNGGDPTGSVGSVAWDSWGKPMATGTGISTYVGPNQSVVEGSHEPVQIVAFDLGDCDGQSMYRKVEWFFPQHGQSFDASMAEDICNGA
jgi:hypothetical protein